MDLSFADRVGQRIRAQTVLLVLWGLVSKDIYLGFLRLQNKLNSSCTRYVHVGVRPLGKQFGYKIDWKRSKSDFSGGIGNAANYVRATPFHFGLTLLFCCFFTF